MKFFSFTDTSGAEVHVNLRHLCSAFTDNIQTHSGSPITQRYVLEYKGNQGYNTKRSYITKADFERFKEMI